MFILPFQLWTTCVFGYPVQHKACRGSQQVAIELCNKGAQVAMTGARFWDCRTVTTPWSPRLTLARVCVCVALTGYWNITVYGRKHCYRLYTKLLNEATRWSSAIQNVTDTKAPIDTPTQQLIQDIKVRGGALAWFTVAHRFSPLAQQGISVVEYIFIL